MCGANCQPRSCCGVDEQPMARSRLIDSCFLGSRIERRHTNRVHLRGGTQAPMLLHGTPSKAVGCNKASGAERRQRKEDGNRRDATAVTHGHMFF